MKIAAFLSLALVLVSAGGNSAPLNAQEGDQTPKTLVQYPHVTEENQLYYYNEWEGALKRKSLSNATNDAQTVDSAFRNVEHIIWGPQGKQALVKAVNSSPDSRSVRFYNSDAPSNSSQWWVYTVFNKTAELLHEDVKTPAWLNKNTIVYNFDGSDISVKNLESNNMTKLSSNARSVDTLPSDVTAVSSPQFAILPSNTGIHVVNSITNAVNFAQIGKITSLTASQFDNRIIAGTSEGEYILLNLQSNTTTTLNNLDQAQDLVFHTEDTLATLQTNGDITIYDISEQTTQSISNEQTENMSALYPLTSKRSLLVGQQGMVRSRLSPSEEPQQLIPYDTQTSSSGNQSSAKNPDDQPAHLWGLVAGILLIGIAIGLWTYLTFFRHDEDI